MRYWIIIALAFFSPAICANEGALASVSKAEAAFIRGDFAQAVMEGQQSHTGEGLMVACRAGMVLGGFQQSGAAAVNTLHRSLKDCHSVATNTTVDAQTRMNAMITLAIGVGFEGKRWKKPAHAKLSKAILEQVYTDFPNAPSAHAALGGWHAEVSAAGFLARVYLGASRSKAKQLFGDAMVMGETDLPFTLEYVKLLARGGRADREKAATLALRRTRDIPKEAVNQLVHTKLMLIEAALQSDDKRAVEKAIAAATAFNGIEEWRTIPLIDLDFIRQSLGL